MSSVQSCCFSSRVSSTRCLGVPSRRRAQAHAAEHEAPFTRRSLVATTTSIALATLLREPASAAGDAAPSGARLGIDEVLQRLQVCFQEGQYYVSGRLDRGIFEPDCVFIDPTVRVQGTEKYAKAVAEIFSPETSQVDLIACEITGPTTISAEWRLAGVITQGGRDFTFKPYTGKTAYTLDPATGKISNQYETWDISVIDVFACIFFPKFGAAPAPPADVLRKQRATV